MTKSKRIKRGKRGGDGTTSSQPNTMSTQPSNGLMSWFTNAWNATKKTSEGLMNQAQGAISNSNTTPTTSSSTPTTSSSTPTTSSSTPSTSSSTSSSVPSNTTTLVPSTGSFTSTNIGGRKTRKTRRRKGGGYGKVHGLSVAKPTYYLTGGKSRRRRRK
jgi:hypothetical protein